VIKKITEEITKASENAEIFFSIHYSIACEGVDFFRYTAKNSFQKEILHIYGPRPLIEGLLGRRMIVCQALRMSRDEALLLLLNAEQ